VVFRISAATDNPDSYVSQARNSKGAVIISPVVRSVESDPVGAIHVPGAMLSAVIGSKRGSGAGWSLLKWIETLVRAR
jgi:hypothetical protein